MDRREFISASAAVAGAMAVRRGGALDLMAHSTAPIRSAATLGLDVSRHRFGVNYTPSRNWWFCWNEWDADPIKRDLDGIAALGADHLRVLLIWPYFQPNPKYVSPLHLQRLDELLTLMGERNLDALVTVEFAAASAGTNSGRHVAMDAGLAGVAPEGRVINRPWGRSVVLPWRRAYRSGRGGCFSTEGLDGGGFVILNVENGVELGDLHQVFDFVGEVHKLEFALLLFDAGVGADQIAKAGTVDVIDIGKIEKNFDVSLADQVADYGTQSGALFAEDDSAAEIHNRNVTYLSSAGSQIHR